MRAAGGKGPSWISPAVHPGASDDIERLIVTVTPSSRKDQSGLKGDCLKRDGYSCVISNYFDMDSLEHRTPAPGQLVLSTECSHILPFSLRNYDEKDVQRVRLSNLSFDLILTYWL